MFLRPDFLSILRREYGIIIAAKRLLYFYFYGVRLAPAGATGEIANYTTHAARSWHNRCPISEAEPSGDG